MNSALRYDGVYTGPDVSRSVFFRAKTVNVRIRCKSFKKPNRWPKSGARKGASFGRILLSEGTENVNGD